MSNAPSTITVDGVAYTRSAEPGDLHIVILQRGRVVVGNLTIDGDYGTLTNASCVRRWGTTAGLGQLAIDGPTKDAKLDPQPATKFHVLTSVEIIACNAEAWAK